MTGPAFHHHLRYQINRFIFDQGYAPSAQRLAAICHADIGQVEQALYALNKNQDLVLHPNSTDIWVAHPFALFPTLFWVVSGANKWWSNCAWCALGIASLTHFDTDIYTKIAGQSQSIILQVRDGKVLQEDLWVHFARPTRDAWKNVLYYCACCLVFEHEKQVDEWCQYHQKPKGAVVPIKQVWQLSQHWYGYYLEPDWKPKSREKAEGIFRKVGLSSDFWTWP